MLSVRAALHAGGERATVEGSSQREAWEGCAGKGVPQLACLAARTEVGTPTGQIRDTWVLTLILA